MRWTVEQAQVWVQLKCITHAPVAHYCRTNCHLQSVVHLHTKQRWQSVRVCVCVCQRMCACAGVIRGATCTGQKHYRTSTALTNRAWPTAFCGTVDGGVVSSRIVCADMCAANCLCESFSYNSQTLACRMSNVTMNATLLATDLGFMTYEIIVD
jgi:hypothetical protein